MLGYYGRNNSVTGMINTSDIQGSGQDVNSQIMMTTMVIHFVKRGETIQKERGQIEY